MIYFRFKPNKRGRKKLKKGDILVSPPPKKRRIVYEENGDECVYLSKKGSRKIFGKSVGRDFPATRVFFGHYDLRIIETYPEFIVEGVTNGMACDPILHYDEMECVLESFCYSPPKQRVGFQDYCMEYDEIAALYEDFCESNWLNKPNS